MTSPEPSYREIPLTRGMVAIVDAADYDWLMQWKWCATRGATGGFYAMRNSRKEEGGHFAIKMHREILGLKRGDKRVGDHVNTANTLDNRRSNLRVADHSENHANAPIRSNNRSGAKGVFWDKRLNKWRVNVQRSFPADQKEIAKQAYDRASAAMWGEFANPG